MHFLPRPPPFLPRPPRSLRSQGFGHLRGISDISTELIAALHIHFTRSKCFRRSYHSEHNGWQIVTDRQSRRQSRTGGGPKCEPADGPGGMSVTGSSPATANVNICLRLQFLILILCSVYKCTSRRAARRAAPSESTQRSPTSVQQKGRRAHASKSRRQKLRRGATERR